MTEIEWTDAEREAVDAAVDQSTHALGVGYMESPVVRTVADAALDALAALVAAREAQAAAKALREAADDMNARRNGPELIAAADRWGGYYSGVRTAIGNEETALRLRADRIEAPCGCKHPLVAGCDHDGGES